MHRLCACGCGRVTEPYTTTDRRIGAVKGHPAMWLKGHNGGRHLGRAQAARWPLGTTPNKRCSLCRDVFPRGEAHWPAGNIGSRCRACDKVYLRVYRTSRRAKAAATSKGWREANPERARRAVKDWCAQHREQVRVLGRRGSAKRRVRVRAAGSVFDSTINYHVIHAAYQGCCGVCDDPVPYDVANWDHIVALANRGAHRAENLQPTHRRCNTLKGVRSLAEARALVASRRASGQW